MAPPAKNAKFRQIPEMQSSPISPNRIPALFTKLGQRPPEKPQKFMKRLTFEPLPCYEDVEMTVQEMLCKICSVYSEINIIEGYDCDSEACELFDDLIHFTNTHQISKMKMYMQMEIIRFYEKLTNDLSIHKNALAAIYSNTADGEQISVDERLLFLSSLASVAMAMGSQCFLRNLAFWIQSEELECVNVTAIYNCIFEDHMMYELADELLVPIISPHFSCTLISYVIRLHPANTEASVKDYQKYYGLLPIFTLRVISDWVINDDGLLLTSLSDTGATPHDWTSPTKSNTQTSVPELIYNLLLHTCIREPEDKICSQLHLGLIRNIYSFREYAKISRRELVTLTDMRHLSASVSHFTSHSNGEKSNSDSIDLCHNRLLQIMQVAVTVGAFRCALSDLQEIFSYIPVSRLKLTLEKLHFSNLPPIIHTNSPMITN